MNIFVARTIFFFYLKTSPWFTFFGLKIILYRLRHLVFWEHFPSLVPELDLPLQYMANPTLQFIVTHQIVLQAKLVIELLGLWITTYFAIFYHPESLFL